MIKKLFDEGEAQRLIVRARRELELKTQNHLDTWGLARDGRWDASLDTGVITFTTGRGWIVTAPLQVVGTYDELEGTWMWGWDHPSVPPSLAQDAWRVRRFGDRHGLHAYTNRLISCPKDEAWNFAAVACHLAGSQGVYDGADGATSVFMTFGELQFHERGS